MTSGEDREGAWRAAGDETAISIVIEDGGERRFKSDSWDKDSGAIFHAFAGFLKATSCPKNSRGAIARMHSVRSSQLCAVTWDDWPLRFEHGCVILGEICQILSTNFHLDSSHQLHLCEYGILIRQM